MGDIILELDELWSFVNYKINKVWIWIVIDRKTRRILACYLGDRTRKSAQKLWDSLPERYRQNSTCYTDFWQAYKKVIPDSQHRPVGKESRETNHMNAQAIHLDKDCLGLFVELFPSQKVSLICGVLYGILSSITMHNSQIHNSITTLEFLPRERRLRQRRL
jgi:IS1 family transposase